MPASSYRGLALGLTSLMLLTACSTPSPEPPRPVALEWREVAVPHPVGPPGRLALRDATVCAGRWYLTGAVIGANGTARPAAWTSLDGSSWTALAMNPRSYYGKISIVYAAGCREGRLAAIGAQSGGAHGNPRISTWYLRPDGSMDEVEAPSEHYGGPKATNVGRLTGGPAGWVIAGNRSSGAAAWVSSDSAEFRIIEGAPELASDQAGVTWAADAAPFGAGWLMVGGYIRVGRIDRDPMAWTSPDGQTWRRSKVPGDDTAYDELQRVAVSGSGALAVGPRGQALGSWRLDGGDWHATATFGAGSGRGIPSVRSLAALDGALFATASDGERYRMWTTADAGDSWREIGLPAATPTGFGTAAMVAGADGRVVLLIDDGRKGALWSALPRPS